ncbi:hypothetical protein GCM10009743_51530 [Kribbella swartbergensis]
MAASTTGDETIASQDPQRCARLVPPDHQPGGKRQGCRAGDDGRGRSVAAWGSGAVGEDETRL